MDYYAKYYREWLDVTVPALDGKTPREAATVGRLHGDLEGLIHGLEGMYEQALKRGEPAYDPSWMWQELGFRGDTDPSQLPLLAHERMEQMAEGFGEVCRRLADSARQRPDFDEKNDVLSKEDITANLDVQRFLREREHPEGNSQEGEQTDTAVDLVPYLSPLANHALHLRKTFYVDDALVYMLAETDADVPGSDLRMPFKSLALVFTARHALSLAERLLSADGKSSLAGHILRVLTVYVAEMNVGENRVLRITMAPDALGADPPELVSVDVPMPDVLLMSRIVERAAETTDGKESTLSKSRKGELVGLVLNGILYATSAGVNAEPRPPRRTARTQDRGGSDAALAFTSDEVFHLPGPIEISRAKELQDLGKTSEGRRLIHRFMVRGHWRRPNPSWKDQRLRWVAPYWKGPDLAAIIERTYRLTP